ncbi:hypothetical protein FRC15_009190 [Serendipita sp. 397]|nr:hypothetical protein FRC15_009190 [Serendipita sp. 397]
MLFVSPTTTALIAYCAVSASASLIQSPIGHYHADKVELATWTVRLNETWDVLGPFPQHAREQHFVSPLYPLSSLNAWANRSTPMTYPSSLAKGGTVEWFHIAGHDGYLKVSFPDIPWETLRKTEGWAALQHHALLHSTFTMTPPPSGTGINTFTPVLVAEVRQASFFAIVPEPIPTDFTPTWHNGNIYNLLNSPIQLLPLPSSPSLESPTLYHIFVSGDYEIRLFGDPEDVENQETPVQRLEIRLDVLQEERLIAPQSQLDVVPDFVDGWVLSKDGALGIGMMALHSWWAVIGVESTTRGVQLELMEPRFRLAPLQTRVLPLRLRQTARYRGHSISISVIFQRNGSYPIEIKDDTMVVNFTIPVAQKQRWDKGGETYKATYHLESTPSYFMVKAPRHCNPDSPALLALHGAGVEAESTFWTGSIRAQNSSWIIFPTGRTSWGFDWHGPSSVYAWGALDAFRETLAGQREWKHCSIGDPRVLLIGHSNGGQGVWYHASRFPDRTIAAVAAAAYIKSQQYVPLSLSHGAHFTDIRLRMILESSLQPDDNDLFLSNLGSTPILAIHGGGDRNVPTWHTRELMSTLRSWYPNADARYHEVDDAPHWWDRVLSSNSVQDFIDNTLSRRHSKYPSNFTLTTLVPEENGSMHGFQIVEVARTGALARLRVQYSGNSVAVSTVNTRQFSLDLGKWGNISSITIDMQEVSFIRSPLSTLWFTRDKRSWRILERPQQVRVSGPMNRILATSQSLTIVTPQSDFYLHSALRIAHNSLSYLRIDSRIVSDEEAFQLFRQGLLDCSNLVILGGADNLFGQAILAKFPSVIKFIEGGWIIRGQRFDEPGQGIVFLHPHPICSTSLALFVSGTEISGFERALRLIPLRTGVGVPEWIITSNAADSMGAGGLLGAGYWGPDWEWNESLSWLAV